MENSRERLFSFPDPVNEVAARLVAAGVVVLSVLAIAARRRDPTKGVRAMCRYHPRDAPARMSARRFELAG